MGSIHKKISSILFLVALAGVFFLALPGHPAMATTCSDIGDITSQTEDQLKADLAICEQEIAQQQANLAQQQTQSKTIKGDISVLTTKINAAQLNIKASNVIIAQLTKDISNKNQTIKDLSNKLDDSLTSLGQLMRKTSELDNQNYVYLILSGSSLSQFYGDIDSFSSINKSVKEMVDQIRGIKTDTEAQAAALQKDQNSQVDTKVALENTKEQIQKNEADKQQLLALSKEKESQYVQYIADRAKKAAQINTALFTLRDANSIQFADALKYAQAAAAKTSVRPAFLLAILTQESNLGQNDGSCYVTNQATGDGVGSKSGSAIAKVMNPTRDIPPFLNILQSLGRVIYKTLVSCPQSIGWGGAMGPAQFIPSTWVMFQDRIAAAAGDAVADPWNPADAFMASALYLGDLGAGAGGYTAESNAACKYYSGRSCSYSSLVASYGSSVETKAKSIQDNIDFLQGN